MAVITPDFYQNIAIAVSRYMEEWRRKRPFLGNTGIVNPQSNGIEVGKDSFIGQKRLYLETHPTVDIPSYTDPTPIAMSSLATAVLTYIKTSRAWAYDVNQFNEVISDEARLTKVSKRVALQSVEEGHRNIDTDIRSVLQGITEQELTVGSASGKLGITNFGQYDDTTRGFYVDMNANGVFGPAATGPADARKLFDTTIQYARGAVTVETAVRMAFGEKATAPYYYLLISNEEYVDLKSLNLVDQDRVTDGDLTFDTIFNGRYRLIVRDRTIQSPTLPASWADTTTGLGAINAANTKVSFVIEPGMILFKRVHIDDEVLVEVKATTYRGAGEKIMVFRQAHVVHPVGYSWAGAQNAFPSATAFSTGTNWSRVVQPTNLGILPIFHA